MRLTLVWKKPGRVPAVRRKILERFRLPAYMSVNHETPCEIREEDMPELEECERRGFIEIRNKITR